MIYLVIAVFVLHAISLPLIVSGVADINTDADHAKITVKFMFVPVFIKNIDVKTIKSRLNGAYRYDTAEDEKQEQPGEKPSAPSGKLKRFLTALAFHILGRVRLRALACKANIGTGDAATSAMTASSVKIALLQTCAFFGTDGKCIEITPDYNDVCLFLDFLGIISLCFADIIFAICATLFDTLRKRTAKRSNYANTVTE